jgi:hypothetical protein
MRLCVLRTEAATSNEHTLRVVQLEEERSCLHETILCGGLVSILNHHHQQSATQTTKTQLIVLMVQNY